MNQSITDLFQALFYGLVEGITEWLPISSTGHIILVSSIPGYDLQARFGASFWDFFMVVIQLGAILAVIVKFFKKLNPLPVKMEKEQRIAILKIWLKILIGCLPAGIAGILIEVLLDDAQKAMLNSPLVVAIPLVLYGILFVLLERWQRKKENRFKETVKGSSLPANPYPYRYPTTSSLSYLTVLYIGLFQILSIIPGTSRSGVTILSALYLGASRTVAAEFSFFLSIPIMIGASAVKLFSFARSGTPLTYDMNIYLWFGVISAFLVSLAVVKLLMNWVKKHDFELFGYYRIALGILIFGLFLGNVIR